MCHIIISSLRTALKIDWTLKLGVTKQRAQAIIEAVSGPDIPIHEINSDMLCVNLKGTGLLPSNSPENQLNDESIELKAKEKA